MKSLISDITLFQITSDIKSNFETLNKEFPKVYLAAENINNVFYQILNKELKIDMSKFWFTSSKMMIFGIYQSWLFSYILTSAAVFDIGMMSLRRAIEFTCYITKIFESDKRAKMWMNQITNEKSNKQFKNKFSIPTAYLNKKYDCLKYLLITYDFTSVYGSHANFEMLSQKRFKEQNPKKLTMQLFDDENEASDKLGYVLLYGYRIIEAVKTIFESYLIQSKSYKDSIGSLNNMIREARIEIANIKYNGNIPRKILVGINEDNKSEMDKAFEELKLRYKTKTSL